MIKRLLSRFQGDSYQARSMRGSALTAFQFGAQNVLRLGSNLVLTRLLFPEAFGLMALVTVLTSGVAMFSIIGIRGSIIKEERATDPHFLNTAWTLSIIRGVILTVIVLLLARPFAAFYEQPILVGLLTINAFVLFFKGFNSMRILVAQREIQLGRLTALTIGTQVVSLLIMAGLAWWLQTVWALAIGNVISVILTMAGSHLFLPGHQERLGFDRQVAGKIFHFGKWILLATMAAFVIQQGDKAVLGKFVSLETLALYNIALMLATIPFEFGRTMIERVIYPLYARRPPGEDRAYQTKIFRARMGLTGLLLLSVIVMSLIGEALVELLYDPRYEAAGSFLALIALSGLPIIILQSYEKLPLAAGDSGRFAAYKITYALITLGLLLLGVIYYGIGGAIVSRALAAIVAYPLLVITVRRYGGWDPRHDFLFFAASAAVVLGFLWIMQPDFTGLFVPEAPAAEAE